jgi:hypothetical protein
VECAIKACIAKGMQRYEFPDWKKVLSSHVHNLNDLVTVAGLDEAFERVGKDPDFQRNWELVIAWIKLQW